MPKYRREIVEFNIFSHIFLNQTKNREVMASIQRASLRHDLLSPEWIIDADFKKSKATPQRNLSNAVAQSILNNNANIRFYR